MNGITALEQYRQSRASGETEAAERLSPWQKLRANPSSRALAIAAMCAQCMGWDEGRDRPSGVVNDIRTCTSPGCPLYGVRPYRSPTRPVLVPPQKETA